MDLNDKIKQIMVDKNMSPSFFADEIGIQRSSMSHIIAGRNKPSLDIVQKIVRRFPELGTNWILDDEVLPMISPDISSVSGPTRYFSNGGGNAGLGAAHPARNPDRSQANKSAALPNTATVMANDRRIEQIMIFYSDGTFEEVKPA
ncbi:helix-turn-helix domain-containing protein [Dyadobacter chenwenxiniae]|uniref:helix-turn-helix transcriptional regulator n=1 Tax=Dyadobacter chenwenxiniae TaxID=2906456 RepID=UPI001FD154F9|nr:helix-turn-helix transcriptional regulator [Dyadobacter chenwenxiniae]UON84767.1 helix-turn-helix domain-containing protein [Dyadobacter chenwenxiniae]